jgi:apolipoprotein N-acyltransferase
MTFFAIAIFASPAILIDDHARTKRPWLPLVISLLLLGVAGGYGAWRLEQHPTQFVSGVKLRLMQPNLQQDVKFSYSAKDAVLAKYMALSDRATGPQTSGVRDATILIWPESAFPFFLTREPAELAKIAGFLPPQTTLITGAVRAPNLSPAVKPTRAYNSIYVINHDGDILSVYDKLHLVPFGEYLPFQGALEKLGFQQITKVQGGFIPGARRRVMSIPGAPHALPLICYEVAFSGHIMPEGERPGWIVNLTNDGWFGDSTGPYQHLQMARLRAIEEGLPIVRSANTGISAVIDPVGREVGHLALGQEAVLDSALPAALPPTVFARWRHMPLAVLVVLATLFVLMRRRRTA